MGLFLYMEGMNCVGKGTQCCPKWTVPQSKEKRSGDYHGGIC